MQWLFKDDDYTPTKDKDAFLDKSILSMLKVISKIQTSGKISEDGFLYEVNVFLKLVSAFVFIIFLSLSMKWEFIIASAFIYIIFFLFIKSEDKKKIFTMQFTVFIFTFLLLLPSIILKNINNSFMILFKVTLSIGFVSIFSYTSSWYESAKALKILFIPDIFIFVLETALRYIYLLGQESLLMLTALKIKMVGKNNEKYKSISNVMGNLFLKSKTMGEEMYSAMECRGFTGEYSSKFELNLKKYDYIYILMVLVYVCLFFTLR